MPATGRGGGADAVVVGAGIVGSASAAILAAAGLRVVVVDRAGIAAAASGRNSGVVQHPFDPLLAGLYRDTVALLRELEAEAPDRFRLPPEPAGLLYVGEDPRPARELADGFARTHPELAPAFLAGAELQDLEPALAGDLVACRLAIGYPVGPSRVTEAWAALAIDRGVEFRIGEPAALEVSGGRIRGVRVGSGTIGAPTVVVTAGPWTASFVDPTGRWRPIRALWGAVAEVALPRPPQHVLEEIEIDATIEPDRPAGDPSAAPTPVAFSLVTADGRSVVGSTFTTDEPDDAALVPALLARAARFVPTAGGARVVGSRRCARPLSLDGRPLIGAVPWVDGLFVAAGHGPWGISTGPGSARLLADLVLGRASRPPAPLDPARFGAAPDYFAAAVRR